jgi:phosphotransferase system enzyme I (PtsI)
MITIRGKGVSAGIAAGPLYFYHRETAALSRYEVKDRDAEWQRFKDAQAKAISQLGVLAEKAREEAGDEAAMLFETHQMMCEDMDYEEAIETFIKESGINAEAAVKEAGDIQSGIFAAMEDDYFKARAADIRDISGRIAGILSGVVQGGIDSDVPVILAADDLAPSETIQLDKSKILGFVTSGGSGSGHTAILARTIGIPAIIGTGDQLKEEYAGMEVIMDGDTGYLSLDPDSDTRTKLLNKRDELLKRRELLNELKGQPNISKDNQEIKIYCNIGNPEDVRAVHENDGGGIGLFRSEFLYLNCDDYPTEDYQFEAYKKVMSDMDGKEVVIRTCDIGADKMISYFALPKEENPALGNRALRICLSRPDMFRTQIRALYRASAYGHLSIMFPMVTSVWEVREAKKMCEQVKEELTNEGIPFSENVAVGIMIETPAAALISDRLAKEVDFFSIGTNDLTQYTLACDRQNNDLGAFFNAHHPAVLRLIKMICDNAHREGIWCGICGELGADTELTGFFLSIGIDELSVSPGSVLLLRQKVRGTEVRAIRDKLIEDRL